MDAESQYVEELKESLHEAGVRNATLVLHLREKDLVIETMNEAHKLLIAEKDKLITELADALEHIPIVLTPPDRDLVQRARETRALEAKKQTLLVLRGRKTSLL